MLAPMNKPICPPMSPEKNEYLKTSTMDTMSKLFLSSANGIEKSERCHYNNTFHSAPASLCDIQKKRGAKMYEKSYPINLQHRRLSSAQLFHSSELQRRYLRPESCLWKNKWSVNGIENKVN